MANERTLHSKKYRHLFSLKKFLALTAQLQLARLAKRHLATRRQLIVFSFDHIATQINFDGVYELQELETFFEWVLALAPEVFRDSVAVDAGANIGNHSLYFSDHFLRVHSFEPNPRTFNVLRLNADLVANVICHPIGLSSTEGEALLEVNSSNIGASRISPSPTPEARTIRLGTLDAELASETKIRLIKVDVEGHEPEVLLGAEKIIRSQKPIIIFEQLESSVNAGQSESHRILESFGYRHFALICRTPKVRIPVSRLLSWGCTVFARLLLGERMRISLVEEFKAESQPMVIALPDWLARRAIT